VAAEASPRPLVPRSLLALCAVGAAGLLLWLLRDALTPVLVAFLIAYMLDPVVDRLERWRLPRALAIGVVLALARVVIGLGLLLVVPGVVRELGQFASDLPSHAAKLWQRLEPWLADRGISVPSSVGEALAEFGGDAKALASKAAVPAGKMLGYLAGGTASMLGAVAGLLLIPVFAFYLLYDFDRITAGMRELVPKRLRPFVVDVAREIDEVLGQFIRGQLSIMLILAVLYSVAYSLVGVRLAVPIGIVAGLLSFIPYVGGATALGLALLMCLMVGTSWAQIAGVVGAYAVIQALEGFVITPRIMEEKVGLSAIWVLLALMIFGELFGFFGVLVAVPAAAVIKIFVLRALEHYRRSELFLGAVAGADKTQPDGTLALGGAHSGLGALLAEEGLPDDPALAHDKEHAGGAGPTVAVDVASAKGTAQKPADGATRTGGRSAAPAGRGASVSSAGPEPPKSTSEPPKAGSRRAVKTRSTSTS
jgi:predicted PurR-regulated permease PerM